MTNLTCDTAEPDLKLSETERGVAALWTEILPTAESARPTDNFFEFGGTSIDVVMLLLRIQEEFSIELADGAIFQSPSLREMAKLVEAAREVSQSK